MVRRMAVQSAAKLAADWVESLGHVSVDQLAVESVAKWGRLKVERKESL
jgi:hypothetical protein